MSTHTKLRSILNTAGLALATLFAMTTLSGCLVAGVSSNGGAFIWPGGLGLVVILIVLFLIFRRR